MDSRIAETAISDMLSEMLTIAQTVITTSVPAILGIVAVVAVGMFVIKIGKRIVSKAG